MDQTSKKARKAFDFDSHLCCRFTGIGKWIAVYFCVALECDTPILEAYLYVNHACVGYRANSDNDALLRKIRDFAAELLAPDYRPSVFTDKPGDDSELLFFGPRGIHLTMEIEDVDHTEYITKELRIQQHGMYSHMTAPLEISAFPPHKLLIFRSDDTWNWWTKFHLDNFQETLEQEIKKFLMPK